MLVDHWWLALAPALLKGLRSTSWTWSVPFIIKPRIPGCICQGVRGFDPSRTDGNI